MVRRNQVSITVSNKRSPLSNTDSTRHYEDTCYSQGDHWKIGSLQIHWVWRLFCVR